MKSASEGEGLRFAEAPDAILPDIDPTRPADHLSPREREEAARITEQASAGRARCSEHQAMQYLLLREHVLYALESTLQATNLAQNLQAFVSAMQAMRYGLTRFADPVVVRLLHAEPHYTDLRAKLRPLNNLYLRFLEEYVAQALLSENPTIFLAPDWRLAIENDELRTRLANKSNELTSLASYDIRTSVAVGCGSFPDTLVYLRENTAIPRITGLDSEYSSVSTASMIVNTLQPGEPEGAKRIRIQQAYGEDFDYQGADHVHIAGYVPDKTAILARIIATNPGQRVIVTAENYAGSPFHLLHDDLEPQLSPFLRSGRLTLNKRIRSASAYVAKEVLYLEISPNQYLA